MSRKIYDYHADLKEFKADVKAIMLAFVLGTTAIVVIGTYLVY